ncbi:MAG TPA: hypothetical protein PLM87_00785 [Bacteroidales bacterium]|nr:hypothetical protein [Bacteroidales bacterium]
MKNKIVYLLILFALLTSCSQSKKVEGEWQFLYITPIDSIKSEGDLLAFAWLNILADTSIITFRNDSLFVNNLFQSKYKLKNSAIYFKEGDSLIKAYDYIISNDTLILENSTDSVIIKMKKKSS